MLYKIGCVNRDGWFLTQHNLERTQAPSPPSPSASPLLQKEHSAESNDSSISAGEEKKESEKLNSRNDYPEELSEETIRSLKKVSKVHPSPFHHNKN